MIVNLDQIQGISINILYKNIIDNIKDKLIQYSQSGHYNNSTEYNDYIINIFFNLYQFYIEIPQVFNFKNFIYLWLENQISLYNSILLLFKKYEEKNENDSLKQFLLNGIYILKFDNIYIYIFHKFLIYTDIQKYS